MLLATPVKAAAGVLELSRQRAERGVETRALYLLAEVALHDPRMDVETAFDRYQQAASLGQRPLVAHCHLGLGKLYWRIAKRAEAEAKLVIAAKLYGAMGMPFWLERAEAEMRKLG